MRYKKLPKHKGIYQDSKSAKFYCQKRINKKLHSETFTSLKEALWWMKEFDPTKEIFKVRSKNFNECNGRHSVPFLEVVEQYKEEVYPTLLNSSREERDRKIEYLEPIFGENMLRMNPQVVTDLLLELRKKATSRRCNFNHELKTLNIIFNWYKDNRDFTFTNPINTGHRKLSKVKDVPERKRKMEIEELVLFFNSMREINALGGTFARLAEFQFKLALRIQEAAAFCLIDQMDFTSGEIEIDRSISWSRKEAGNHELKMRTKTGVVKHCKASEGIRVLVLEQANLCPNNESSFLFHDHGKMLTYRQIQRAYNTGLSKAGLSKKYSSTHIMRHTMAKHTRSQFGIDHAQAVGGWGDVKTAELYSGSPETVKHLEALNFMEEKIKRIQIQ